MKPRKRQIVRKAELECLEGRELLSGMALSLRHAAAQIMRMPHARTHLGAIAQGAVNTNFTFQAANGALNGKALRANLALLSRPTNSQTPPPVATQPLGIQTFQGPQTNLTALQQGIGIGPRITMSPGSVTNGAIFLPIQIGATGATGSASSVGSTLSTTSTLTTSVANGIGSTLATTSTLPTTTSSAPGQTTAVATVTGTGGAVATPIMMTGPSAMLGNVTLSSSDVSSLKSAVNTFASSYTSGANASADSAAVSTLQAALKSLDATILSESHVVPSSNLVAFQQAVSTFVSNYTSGKNPSADAAAWSAFQSALSSFGQSVQPSNMPAGTNPGGNGPMSMRPGRSAMGMPGLSLTGLLNAIVSGPTLSSAQVSTLKSGIDTFASAYTSGANATTDASAVTTLESSIDGLLTATPMHAMPPVFTLFNQPSLTKAQVTTIQTAVDSFATNYTSGANPTADSAAVSALQSSLQSVAPTPPTTTSTSTNTTTSPMSPPPQGPGGGFLGFLSNTTLTKTQVAALKSAVDTFASNYTSGANATSDSASIQTLETSLASALPAPTMATPIQGLMMMTNPGAPPGNSNGMPNGTG